MSFFLCYEGNIFSLFKLLLPGQYDGLARVAVRFQLQEPGFPGKMCSTVQKEGLFCFF